MTSVVYRTFAAGIAVALLLSAGGVVYSQEVVDGEPNETDASEEDTIEAVVVIPLEDEFPLDDEGRLVRFGRDIAPILSRHCLECHGPEDAKNDFRVDDPETLLMYVEPEDVESSTLYVDYLVIDDEDMLMPPKSHGGPLSAAELALIRVWIEEGADWPEDYEMIAGAAVDDPDEGSTEEPVETSQESMSLGERIWAFQGYLHPATVHFPIALFLFGGLFVVLGWKWPRLGTQIPLACLLLGSISAVASTLMGWAFAPEQGYGNNWLRLDWDREVDVHRWSAVIATVVSVVLALVALAAMIKGSDKLNRFWKVGLLVLAGMIGAVGHQGGEMSYGSDFYPKAFRILFGTSDQVASVEAESVGGSAADEEGSESSDQSE